MTNLTQNNMEHITDLLERRVITVDEANVMKVRYARVQLVTSRIPASVRKALNEAVKRGELGHIKKDGRKPEAYYHPSFDYLVRKARNDHEAAVIKALSGVITRAFEDR